MSVAFIWNDRYSKKEAICMKITGGGGGAEAAGASSQSETGLMIEDISTVVAP